MEKVKQVIGTTIGYFKSDSPTLLIENKEEATLFDSMGIQLYFDSISSDIAIMNKQEIKAWAEPADEPPHYRPGMIFSKKSRETYTPFPDEVPVKNHLRKVYSYETATQFGKGIHRFSKEITRPLSLYTAPEPEWNSTDEEAQRLRTNSYLAHSIFRHFGITTIGKSDIDIMLTAATIYASISGKTVEFVGKTTKDVIKDMVKAREDEILRNVDRLIAQLLGWKLDKNHHWIQSDGTSTGYTSVYKSTFRPPDMVFFQPTKNLHQAFLAGEKLRLFNKVSLTKQDEKTWTMNRSKILDEYRSLPDVVAYATTPEIALCLGIIELYSDKEQVKKSDTIFGAKCLNCNESVSVCVNKLEKRFEHARVTNDVKGKNISFSPVTGVRSGLNFALYKNCFVPVYLLYEYKSKAGKACYKCMTTGIYAKKFGVQKEQVFTLHEVIDKIDKRYLPPTIFNQNRKKVIP